MDFDNSPFKLSGLKEVLENVLKTPPCTPQKKGNASSPRAPQKEGTFSRVFIEVPFLTSQKENDPFLTPKKQGNYFLHECCQYALPPQVLSKRFSLARRLYRLINFKYVDFSEHDEEWVFQKDGVNSCVKFNYGVEPVDSELAEQKEREEQNAGTRPPFIKYLKRVNYIKTYLKDYKKSRSLDAKQRLFQIARDVYGERIGSKFNLVDVIMSILEHYQKRMKQEIEAYLNEHEVQKD